MRLLVKIDALSVAQIHPERYKPKAQTPKLRFRRAHSRIAGVIIP